MKKLIPLLLIPFTFLSSLVAQTQPAAPVNLVPQNMQSQNFYQVAKYLDLGGTIYGYLDVDGDLSGLAQHFKELLQMIPADPEDPQAAMMKNMDFEYIMDVMGFSNVKAMGISSYKVDTFFHNKGFMLMEGGPKGIFQLGGAKAHPFEIWDLAPAGSDLLFEQDINLYSLYQMVETLMTKTMGDMGKMMLDSKLNEPIQPGMPFTGKQLLEKLNTRALGVVRFSPDTAITVPVKESNLPGMDSVTFPLVDFYMSLDNLGWLVDHAIKEFEEQPNLKLLETDTWRGIPLPAPLPPFLSAYQPYFLHELGTGRMVIISRPMFMNECLQRSRGVQADPEFAKAIQGLPTSGNGFSYISTEAFQHVSRILRQAVAAQPPETAPASTPQPGENASQPTAVALASKSRITQEQLDWMLKLVQPYNQPIASVYRAQKDGGLFVANQPFSHKGNFFMSLAPNPLILGAVFFTGLSTPKMAMMGSEEDPVSFALTDDFGASRGPSSSDMNSLRQLAIAYNIYTTETGGHIPANTPGVHAWAQELASKTDIKDASLYWLISDPIVQEHPGDVPNTVNDKSFAGMPLSLSVVAGLPANAGGRTPIAWTRGLESNGKWAADAPYGSSGGLILFLDGSVQRVADASEILVDYESQQPTSDIRKAVPAAASILSPSAVTVPLIPVEE